MQHLTYEHCSGYVVDNCISKHKLLLRIYETKTKIVNLTQISISLGGKIFGTCMNAYIGLHSIKIVNSSNAPFKRKKSFLSKEYYLWPEMFLVRFQDTEEEERLDRLSGRKQDGSTTTNIYVSVKQHAETARLINLDHHPALF